MAWGLSGLSKSKKFSLTNFPNPNDNGLFWWWAEKCMPCRNFYPILQIWHVSLKCSQFLQKWMDFTFWKFWCQILNRTKCLSPKNSIFESIGCSLRPISTKNEPNIANFQIKTSRTCFARGLLDKMNVCHESALY